MDEINERINDLVEAICRTDIYSDYIEQEKQIRQNPELCERLRKFRGDNFRLQNQSSALEAFHPDISRGELSEAAGAIYQESRLLREYDVCNAYLDAELALCKLLQKIACQICDGIEFDVPEI